MDPSWSSLPVAPRPGLQKPVIVFGTEERFVVGRASQCDMVLYNTRSHDIQKCVSRTHFVLTNRPTEDGIVLFDSSSFGTFVNGLRISTCTLRDGDHISIGTTGFYEYIYDSNEHAARSAARTRAAAFYAEQAAEVHRLRQQLLLLEENPRDPLCPTEAAICYHETIRVIQFLERSEFRSSCDSFHDLEVARAESLASAFQQQTRGHPRWTAAPLP